MEQNSANARDLVYQKPTLHRLGLLRLMTRFSFAHGDDDQQGNNEGNHQHSPKR